MTKIKNLVTWKSMKKEVSNNGDKNQKSISLELITQQQREICLKTEQNST